MAGSQRLEKGGWLVGSRRTNSMVHGSTTAPSARQKKLAGGSPGRRIERREKKLDHGGMERRLIDNGDCRL